MSPTSFHAAIHDFVTHKRALNRKYHNEARALDLFARALAAEGITEVAVVTPPVIEQFLASRPRSTPRSYNHLLGVLRVFFAWLVDYGMLATSPVRIRARRRTQGRVPFIFDLAHAQRLITVAAALPDNARTPQRGMTYATAFALLYGLGLRVGELTRLTRADVDLERRLLVIRETKFGKSRVVPFGPRLALRLADYMSAREGASEGDRHGPLAPAAPVFSFLAGRAIHPGTLSQTFLHLVRALAFERPDGVARPRLHDLRHSFAVGTLLRWYQTGANPAAHLLQLSTFLGHVDPASTAVYLTMTADLLDAASARFAGFAAPLAQRNSPAAPMPAEVS